MLPKKQLIGFQGVKMFLLKDPFLKSSSEVKNCPISGFVPIWFFEFCCNLIFLSQFEFSCFVTTWVLSHFEFLSFFLHNLIFVTIWVLSQFEFCDNLTFVTIWVLSLFEFCHKFEFCHIGFFSSSKFEFLSFVTTWVFEFCHNLSFDFCHYSSFFLISSQFEFLS